MRLRYRVWQYWQSLIARPLSVAAQQEIATILTVAEQQLFYQFSPNDQAHSYRVLVALKQAGQHHPALLTAALLHDIGKTRHTLTVWERITAVLGQRLAPQKVASWGQGEAVGWRKAFVIKQQHAAWGADMTAAIGSHPMVVSLIRRHQDILNRDGLIERKYLTEEDTLLQHLQWADDQN